MGVKDLETSSIAWKVESTLEFTLLLIRNRCKVFTKKREHMIYDDLSQVWNRILIHSYFCPGCYIVIIRPKPVGPVFSATWRQACQREVCRSAEGARVQQVWFHQVYQEGPWCMRNFDGLCRLPVKWVESPHLSMVCWRYCISIQWWMEGAIWSLWGYVGDISVRWWMEMNGDEWRERSKERNWGIHIP